MLQAGTALVLGKPILIASVPQFTVLTVLGPPIFLPAAGESIVS